MLRRSLPLLHRLHRSLSSSSLPPLSQPPTHGHLPNTHSALTPSLHFFNSVLPGQIPTYRVLDSNGVIVDGAEVPDVGREFARRLYETMMLLPAVDNVLYNAQRHGSISFYMTTHGEEAAVVGSAAALSPTDEVLGQYRELGVLLWRSYPLSSIMAQCFSSMDDPGKGRQMPVHFGSPAHHFHTISSPLATQIPQAAGVAFALKRDPARKGDVAICYFGEGAASEGDFHAGLGMASVLGGPLIFFCRNNGFAISTPAAEQYAGDGIASRGPGYGIRTVRVDGNDAWAVYNAVKEARRLALEYQKPVLVEAMTYRVGHHSTSDDSYAYRPKQEVEDWKRIDNPLFRLRRYLESQSLWSESDESSLRTSQREAVLAAFRYAESRPKPRLGQMFTDVWGGEEPWMIREDREEMGRLLNKYGNVWEGWRRELERFDAGGRDMMGAGEEEEEN
ncbi:branched-chain alpha-keto acid dehydrogenase E1-alpha subunit [Dacryopinax primogenitus]|uniref:2-oxoisovalerate dehydrogenase subunit alpha n=1 Tax=Dacryopinax primogenitus (strain DJM 731) TaxID=1858805 RepID=M5FYH1_DACPD|nr:branched-chain alpha-keto acid dehydrogenase E1-alpha subunit [Dacryopinax primogenitus]EJT98596.1 branched-chain alpha-keto acid dehydrogenase E1-alpha subunit [Dacryopinax primogenitus]